MGLTECLILTSYCYQSNLSMSASEKHPILCFGPKWFNNNVCVLYPDIQSLFPLSSFGWKHDTPTQLFNSKLSVSNGLMSTYSRAVSAVLKLVCSINQINSWSQMWKICAAVGGSQHCNNHLSSFPSRYVSALTTPARLSPVEFHYPPLPPQVPTFQITSPNTSHALSLPPAAAAYHTDDDQPLLRCPDVRQQVQFIIYIHMNVMYDWSSKCSHWRHKCLKWVKIYIYIYIIFQRPK